MDYDNTRYVIDPFSSGRCVHAEVAGSADYGTSDLRYFGAALNLDSLAGSADYA
ncbi:hypothetical protein D3C87_2094900 [compost metagenome]